LNFKTKLLAIAVLPVIAIAIASFWVINRQAEILAQSQIVALEQRTLEAKRAELAKMNQMALNAIRPLYENSPLATEEAQKQAKQLLHNMEFGEDGYFFVYSNEGTNLVHPRLPELVGKNWWDLQDPDGDYVIRNLISVAQEGGGFHSYVWNKPSTGKLAPKIGHAVMIKPWNWMVGTGLYTDDVAAEVAMLRESLQTSIDNTRRVLIYVTAIGVLLAALFTYLIRLSEQGFADRRLKELTHRIVEVQEDERKRVSTELHDSISQLLVSARYGLDQVMNGIGTSHTANKAVNKSMGILDTAIGEVRRISMALRPSVLDDIGLAAAIKSLSSEFGEQFELSVHTNTEPVGNRISENARTAIYRVAQEALTNIVKHADASHVWVTLSSNQKSVALTIEDDGPLKDLSSLKAGKSAADHYPLSGTTTHSGMGMRNMQERIDAFQGTLTATRSNRGGLKIQASLPVNDTWEKAENNNHSKQPATRPNNAA